MTDPIRCALFTPISTHQAGNGLAHRARFWKEVLAQFGSVTTVLIPLAGVPMAADSHDADAMTVPLVEPIPMTRYLPLRAQRAPEREGRRWATDTHAPFDLVVVLRAYCAPFAFGAVAGTAATVLVDVDDDDATFLADAGELEEAEKYRSLLDEIASRADHMVSVTGFGATTTVANSVAPSFPRPTDRVPGRRVVMVGNFGYAPNVDGARWFIDEVLPVAQALGPALDVVIAGPGSDVLVPYGVGFAPDLDELYRSVDVVVVPLLSGSGSRIKAIEAFAAGVPVVGTTVGLSGLDIRPGVDCLVADDPSSFASAMVRLLDDSGEAAAIAANATTRVVPMYSRAFVATAATQLLRQCLADPAARLIGRARGLETTESSDGLAVTDTETTTVHHLNASAAAVFWLADGSITAAEMYTELAEIYGASAQLLAAVDAALAGRATAGLIVTRRRQN